MEYQDLGSVTPMMQAMILKMMEENEQSSITGSLRDNMKCKDIAVHQKIW